MHQGHTLAQVLNARWVFYEFNEQGSSSTSQHVDFSTFLNAKSFYLVGYIHGYIPSWMSQLYDGLCLICQCPNTVSKCSRIINL